MPKNNINQIATDVAVIKERLNFIAENFEPGGKMDQFCIKTSENSNSISWMKVISSIALGIIVPIIGYLFINH